MRKLLFSVFSILFLSLPAFSAPVSPAVLEAVDDPSAPPLAVESEIAAVELVYDGLIGRDRLELRFNAEASGRMYEYTRANIGKRLAILVDGNAVASARVLEPVSGRIAVAGLKPEQAYAYARRYPALLSIKNGGKAMLAGAPALFTPVPEKPGEYTAILPDGRSVRLHLIADEADAKAPGAVEKIRENARSFGTLFETKTGVHLIYRLPLKDRSAPATLCGTRGIVGKVIVGMEAEIPAGDETALNAAETFYADTLTRLTPVDEETLAALP